MKNLIQAAVVTLFAASTVQAQQAVQWKVSDGGNGHWYQLSVTGPITWPVAKSAAEVRGGHLATLTSDAEKRFAQAVVAAVPGFGESAVRRWGPWLGGFQDRTANDYSEPRSGWRWITGESWSYVAWPTYQPDNWCAETRVEEDFLSFAGSFLQGDGAWNDLPSDGCDNDPVVSYVIEWDADCNGDGIVDYGQCHDGTLPDYNGNNVPDCCERGEACTVGNYPVQWRDTEGGNGHWYALRISAVTLLQAEAQALATAQGANLLCARGAEFDFAIASVGALAPSAWTGPGGPWIGLSRTSSIDWRWIDGSACSFDRWDPGQPNGGADTVALLWSANTNGAPQALCHDHTNERWSRSFVVEWSADCNGDGIVDKGQILRGQLPDTNDNGVPDGCEVATCIDADIYRDFNVNGADLGILLSQWGPNTPLTESDLNRDGAVDGLDLGLLLSFWGPCP